MSFKYSEKEIQTPVTSTVITPSLNIFEQIGLFGQCLTSESEVIPPWVQLSLYSSLSHAKYCMESHRHQHN